MAEFQRVALVTGGNRGIGLEVCRQLSQERHKVILTSREGLSGKAAADKLQAEGLDIVYFPLDVTKNESIKRAAEYVNGTFGRLDVLINNAGVLLEGATQTSLEIPLDILRTTMETNVYGPYRLCQAMIPIMRRNRYGRIVNVSSELGQLADMSGTHAAYRISKAALNAMTRVLAAEFKNDNILVNAVSPGWVKTRMGGPQAPRSVAEAAAGIVWAATLPSDGPTGGFFRDRQPIPW